MPHHRLPRTIVVRLVLLLPGCAVLAAAQPAIESSPDWTPTLAANDANLWLAQVSPQRTVFFRRGVSTAFEKVATLGVPIAELLVGPRRLYTFRPDGGFYSHDGVDWAPERVLPERQLPITFTVHGDDFIALIRSPVPGALAQSTTEPAAETRPYDADAAPFTVAAYDGFAWTAVAAAPSDLDAAGAARRQPQLASIRDQIALFWWRAERQTLVWSRLDIDTREWSSPRTLHESDSLRGYWLAEINDVPTVVIAESSDDGETLLARRLLGHTTDNIDSPWRPTTVNLSELPESVRVRSYRAAYGFNQHVALLLEDHAGNWHLRFGQFQDAPAEASIAVADVFAGLVSRPTGPQWLQSITVMALFGVLLALILFRRGAMAQVLPLPPAIVPAWSFQRLVALIIDLGPFLFVFAAFTDVRVFSALEELFGWAIGREAISGQLPANDTLIWWTASVAAHTVYATIMELAVRRTVGKLLVGAHVVSEAGAPAGVGATLLRNLLRLIELMPPMWILAFLVVLSRNRQRAGDIFAHTVVVRRARAVDTPADEPPDKHE